MHIDYDSYQTTSGKNKRVRFLVIHYTAGNFATSVDELTRHAVSAHYLVPDTTDPSYKKAGFSDMRVFSLVHETDRAWHAGVSDWENRSNLNDSSIGIETVYVPTEKQQVFVFPPYPKDQIETIIDLSRNILQRYPDVTPTRVVGHSDIAVGRKSDPGAAFPWKQLYDAGIGAWYDEDTKREMMHRYERKAMSKDEAVRLLKAYGYSTSSAQEDEGFKRLIRAFQLHFRQKTYDGVLDVETAATLAALVQKYHPSQSLVA